MLVIAEYGGNRRFDDLDAAALSQLENDLAIEGGTWTPEACALQWTNVPATMPVRLFLLYNGTRLVGRAIVQVAPGGGSSRPGYFDIGVREVDRRHGFGTMLLKRVASFAVSAGAGDLVVTTRSDLASTSGFLRTAGASVCLELIVSELRLPYRADVSVRADLVFDFECGTPGLVRSIEIADLLSGMRDAPRATAGTTTTRTPQLIREEAARRLATGGVHYTAMARTADGLVAIAYTEASIGAAHPVLLHQHATVVSRPYRGGGAATYLKHEFLRRIAKECPDVRLVRTEVARENTGMRRLNARLGFRDVEQRSDWVISGEALRRLLAENGR